MDTTSPMHLAQAYLRILETGGGPTALEPLLSDDFTWHYLPKSLGGLTRIAGKAQAAGSHLPLDQFLEAGLVDGDLGSTESGNAGVVDIAAGQMMPELGQASAGGQPDISRTQNDDLHMACPFVSLNDPIEQS